MQHWYGLAAELSNVQVIAALSRLWVQNYVHGKGAKAEPACPAIRAAWSLQHAPPAHRAGKHAMLPLGRGRCLFRLCCFCCRRQPWRHLVKWGSGDPGASLGATLLVTTYPWARRCLKGAHVGLPCWFYIFLGEGLPLRMGPGAPGWVLLMQDCHA